MPFDPAAEANALARRFNDLSQSVDDFRLSFVPPLQLEDMSRLKDESQALEDRAHHFTAQAIGATLAAIQPQLGQIQDLTAAATAQLETLNDVQRGISIATLSVSLGAAIAGGDPATIIAAVKALAAGIVAPPSTGADSSTDDSPDS